MAVIDLTQPYLHQLDGKSLSIFVVSVIGCIVSTIVVVLRTWARVSTNAFGLDDGLMVGGLVSHPDPQPQRLR